MRHNDGSALIDLNHATLVQLACVPGISENRARKILEYRDEHGLFGSVEDLERVPGLLHAVTDEMREALTV